MSLDVLAVLNQISETKKVAEKKKIMEKYDFENSLIKFFWKMAYGRVNLHTRKMIPLSHGSEEHPKDFEYVATLLSQLRDRTFSGNAQVAHIESVLGNLHPDCIEVYNRVIKGNLRCGIGGTVANKVWGKDFIKKYPVMLISPYCAKKAAKIVEDGAVMQLKSDGVRGVCEVKDKGGYDFKFFSRQGEEFLGLNDVFQEEIRDIILHAFDDINADVSIDGEFTYIDENGKHDPSKASGIMNKAIQGTATEDEISSLTYLVWDLILEDEQLNYLSRLKDLQQVNWDTLKNVKMVDTWKVSNLEQVAAKYQEIVDAGNEGVVLKSLKNIWKDTRVTDCIKYKEKHSASLKIVGWYYGEKGKEFQNVLGGFVVQSEDGKVHCNTGSGLSFEDRGILSESLDKKGKPIYLSEDGYYIKDPSVDYEEYVGRIVEMEYNKRTKNKEGRETYSLRFPIIKHFRLDKDQPDSLETMILEEKRSRGLKL